MKNKTHLRLLPKRTPNAFHTAGVRTIAVAMSLLGLVPQGHAVIPAPDGGYPGANTAEGTNALFSLTTGIWNTGLGFQALYHDTTGNQNTAIGLRALFNNTEGSQNTATGGLALFSNTDGYQNTATGYQALYYNNATGSSAFGFEALFHNTFGAQNTANGYLAMLYNTSGSYNTAVGGGALARNSDGNTNTAIGASAMQSNSSGSGNIALGDHAGQFLTIGNFNIDIGNFGRAGEYQTIRIGDSDFQHRTFIAGIRGVTTANANAVPVVIDSAGQLGTVSSSRRFKEGIEPMDQESKAVLALKPVTFHYKSDSQNTPQFGLIAEEVAKVDPDLVVRDDKGEIYTVRYDAVNAMLLNEFLKEHRKVEAQGRQAQAQDAKIAKQEKEIQMLKVSMKEQAAQIQKVCAQVQLTRSTPQLAAESR
jgi:hypothetical protein